MHARYVLTIMAEDGPCAWGWLKEAADRSRYVGSSVSDSPDHLPLPCDATVPRELCARLCAWNTYYEHNSRDETMEWEVFSATGFTLARELRDVLAPTFRIEYRRPLGDPLLDAEPIVIIEAGAEGTRARGRTTVQVESKAPLPPYCGRVTHTVPADRPSQITYWSLATS